MSSQNLKKYTILMFNMSCWHDWQNGVRNRNYFVLHELLKRPEINHIIAVDYLPMTMRKKAKMFSRLLRRSLWFHPRNDIQKVSKKLTVLSVSNIKKIDNKLKTLLTNYQLPITIIWSYFPLYINYFDEIPADLKIFDAVDDWSKHPSYRNHWQLLQNNYCQIAKKADIIFTVSDNLRQSLFNGQKNAYWVANGVQIQKSKIKNQNVIQNSKLIIGYIGTIQSRVDFELVKYAAQHHKDKEFIFVGPVWKDAEIKKVRGLKNVKFIGQVHYDKISDYLSKFDVGIIPHKVDDFTRSMDPMKFYEYLAFGLPVVSAQKLTDDRQLLYFADNPADFSEAINLALKENNQELIDRRQKFAEENSWERRVGEMMRIISNF